MHTIRPIVIVLIAACAASAGAAPRHAPPKVELNIAAAPEMREWLILAANVSMRFYDRIVEELGAEGYTPPATIRIALRDGEGVAETSGDRIGLAVSYFKKRPDDVGALVHEIVHVVQQYRDKTPPGWVTEGIADYVRWFVFEPAAHRPRIDPARSRHTDSYQTTAAFFDYLVRTKDPQFVKKLNAACRAGRYSDELWQDLCGRPVEALWDEFADAVSKGWRSGH